MEASLNNTLNFYSNICHKNNDKWWTDINTGERLQRNTGELLMLIVSEISEAMEGDRKNLMDTHLPNRKMFDVELVDALIRIFDLAGSRNVDLETIFWEKMEYNSKRKDHTREERLKENGKKY